MSNVHDIFAARDSAIKAARGLQTGSGDGTSSGMDDGRFDAIDKRLTAIETEQRTHFRWGIGLLLTTTLGLAALIATTSGFLVARIDRAEDRLTRLETNVNELPGKLTGSLNQINQTLFQAITASKQQPIIVVPQPPQAQTAPN